MPVRVIELDPADTFFSVRHRLLWNGRERTVLVLPPRGALLSGIDLVLLQRLTKRERLNVGLVTADKALTRQARALGLPAFSNLTLAKHYRPGWRRAGRPSEKMGFAQDEDHKPPTTASDPTTKRAKGLRLLIFLVSVGLTLGLLAVAAAFALPAATISLRPRILPVQIIADFTADPSAITASGYTVPARRVTFDQPWEVSGPATGNETQDRRRLVALAQQGLSAAAPEHLAARLNPGEILVPSSVTVEMNEEAFDSSDDGATLSLNARLEGLAVREADLTPLILRELSESLTGNYAPDPASLQLQMEPGTNAPTNTFQVTATATGRPEIDPIAPAEQLRGQRAAEAARYLTMTYQLAEPPTIDVRPSWWWSATRGRLPYRAERIRIEVLP